MFRDSRSTAGQQDNAANGCSPRPHWLSRIYRYLVAAARQQVSAWETSLLMRRSLTRPDRVLRMRSNSTASGPRIRQVSQ
jgi:hypothetical protein